MDAPLEGFILARWFYCYRLRPSYFVEALVRIHLVATALAAALVVPGTVFAVPVLLEDFNDGLAASRWSVAVQIEATAQPTTGPDGSVSFAF